MWLADSAAKVHSTSNPIGLTKLINAKESDTITIGNGGRE
jgi:hypothetical protein